MNTALKQLNMVSLDQAMSRLVENKLRWAQTGIDERIAILAEIKERVIAVSQDWAKTASDNKQIPEGSPLEGEEWLSGPYSVLSACNALIHTLSQMNGKKFLDSLPVRKVADDQIAVRVLPNTIWDHLLLSGIKADVWMDPGVTESNFAKHTASAYDTPPEQREGSVSLVLGAGNIASIAPLDCFQKLFTEHSVVMLKLNPVNEYLIDVLEPALAPLIDFGALQITTGGIDVGEYLCNHPDIDSIHITGAGTSHDAIVWGSGAEGAANKHAGVRKNKKEITSELGAVCPTIVVPGPWTKADIRFQAEQVATQKLHNSGFNCVACQILIMPEAWDKGSDFLSALERTIANAPVRGRYYPGADDRLDQFQSNCSNVFNFPGKDEKGRRYIARFDNGDAPDFAQQTEIFAPALGVTSIENNDAETYLRSAIEYCNTQLHGTLGANIVVHPKTRRQLGDKWDELVGELKYGCIGVNAWTGLGFLTVQAPWGAFPGHTLEDVQSGIGFVHNTYMFDRPERTVVEAPFRPFPRNLLHGSMTLLPKPPWFITNRKGGKLGMLLTRFQYRPSFLKIPRIFLNALFG